MIRTEKKSKRKSPYEKGEKENKTEIKDQKDNKENKENKRETKDQKEELEELKQRCLNLGLNVPKLLKLDYMILRKRLSDPVQYREPVAKKKDYIKYLDKYNELNERLKSKDLAAKEPGIEYFTFYRGDNSYHQLICACLNIAPTKPLDDLPLIRKLLYYPHLDKRSDTDFKFPYFRSMNKEDIKELYNRYFGPFANATSGYLYNMALERMLDNGNKIDVTEYFDLRHK